MGDKWTIHARGHNFAVCRDDRAGKWRIVYDRATGKSGQQVPVNLAVAMWKESDREHPGECSWTPGLAGGRTFDRMMERGIL